MMKMKTLLTLMLAIVLTAAGTTLQAGDPPAVGSEAPHFKLLAGGLFLSQGRYAGLHHRSL
jgi:hypothetical protein